jgi:hypothetical protein
MPLVLHLCVSAAARSAIEPAPPNSPNQSCSKNQILRTSSGRHPTDDLAARESGVGLAGSLTPIRNARAGAIGVDKRHAIHEIPFTARGRHWNSWKLLTVQREEPVAIGLPPPSAVRSWPGQNPEVPILKRLNPTLGTVSGSERSHRSGASARCQTVPTGAKPRPARRQATQDRPRSPACSFFERSTSVSSKRTIGCGMDLKVYGSTKKRATPSR